MTEIERAARYLREGKLVAFPTETVYGLGASARDPEAVAKIFAAKGRPIGHPLIVHLPSADYLDLWARDVPDSARVLAARFWPGPLTIILNKQPDVPAIVTGDQDTIGLRMPDHEIARALLETFGDGVAAPSANRFGKVSPTSAAHVREELGDAVDLVLDGGPSRVGIESTIVDLSGEPRLLRPGAVTREALEEVLGPLAIGGAVRAPGTHASHYAPRAELRAVHDVEAELANALRAGKRTVIIGARTIGGVPLIELPDEPAARAQRLYAALREIDERGFEVAIVALPASDHGLDRAIADRLRRASFRS
jgi:L-threonylcarbamoyladenylate synthase